MAQDLEKMLVCKNRPEIHSSAKSGRSGDGRQAVREEGETNGRGTLCDLRPLFLLLVGPTPSCLSGGLLPGPGRTTQTLLG